MSLSGSYEATIIISINTTLRNALATAKQSAFVTTINRADDNSFSETIDRTFQSAFIPPHWSFWTANSAANQPAVIAAFNRTYDTAFSPTL